MKIFALLSLVVPLAAGATPSFADAMAVPSPASRLAVLCLTGLAPLAPCETLFVAAASRMYVRGYSYQYGIRSVRFARNASGHDVWDVRALNGEMTYVIGQPYADGKIRSLAILDGPASNLCVNAAMTFDNFGRGYASCRVIAQAR